MGTPVSLVVDTDTGSDDAVALLMAARHPDVTIHAVTTVAGNVPLSQATRNALVTLDVAERTDVPVFEGVGRPLLRALDTAQDVHGDDGMSGVPFPVPSRSVEAATAVERLLEIGRDEPGHHTLVTLGPLTNIAAALVIDPLFLTRFTRVVAMGGAFDGIGNVHRSGEFNIWADPEAAKITIDAAGIIEFVGWDMSWRHAVITSRRQAELRALGPLGEFVVDINRCVDDFARSTTGLDGFDLPDPLAMAVAIDREVATGWREVNVDVGLDTAGRGGTFVDNRMEADPANARVVTDIDEARFQAMLAAACAADG